MHTLQRCFPPEFDFDAARSTQEVKRLHAIEYTKENRNVPFTPKSGHSSERSASLAVSSRSREYLASLHCLPQRLKRARLSIQLQQGFAAGEMGFTDKFALQTILNGPSPLWVFTRANLYPAGKLTCFQHFFNSETVN